MIWKIVFMNNPAAIFFTLGILPLIVITLFQLRKNEKRIATLKKERDEAFGRVAVGENFFEDGDEYEFLFISGLNGKKRFLLRIKDDNNRIRYCYLSNSKRWRTDDELGFNPKLDTVYLAHIQDNVIHLNKKGSKH